MTIIPNEFDVLCGRGKNRFLHKGNDFFRLLIAVSLETYKSASTKKLKMEVVAAIVDAILSRGGRFLVQDSHGLWRDDGKNYGKKKTGNALRDAARGRIKCIFEHKRCATDNLFQLHESVSLSSHSRREDILHNEKLSLLRHYHCVRKTSLSVGFLDEKCLKPLDSYFPTDFEPTTDWKLESDKDALNTFLDCCIVDEFLGLERIK